MAGPLDAPRESGMKTFGTVVPLGLTWLREDPGLIPGRLLAFWRNPSTSAREVRVNGGRQLCW